MPVIKTKTTYLQMFLKKDPLLEMVANGRPRRSFD